MTFSEFEAWLEGFKEAMDGKAPTKPQWEKIQKKLALVTPDKEPYPYIYLPYHWYVNTTIPWYSSTSIDCGTRDWKDQIGSWCATDSTITTVSGEQITYTVGGLTN